MIPLCRPAVRCLPVLLVVGLAACSGGEPAPPAKTRPAPAAPAAPSSAPRPAPADDSWIDAATTPGQWLYRRDERGSLALFGVAGQSALVTLRCDRAARALYLSRASGGAAATGFTIRTTTRTDTLPARPTGGTPPYDAVALMPGAPILAAMAYSRGRFALDAAGARLVLPARPELTRVLQDCA